MVELAGSQFNSKTKRSQIALNNLGSEHGYFLSTKLDDNWIAMLVDSGANVSILSKQTIENLPYFIKPKLEPVNTSLISLTGESTPFLGKTEVEICIGNQKVKHTFLIADIKQDGILGLDFLTKNKCDLMFSKGYIVLHGERIPCIWNSNQVEAIVVVLLFLKL